MKKLIVGNAGMTHALSWLTLLFVACLSACEPTKTPVREVLRPEGLSCESDSECETGLCDALPKKSATCMRKCTAGCLENEVCSQLGLDSYGCVPVRAGLCEACTTDADCPYKADKCLQLGGERFCGRDCSFDGKCPDSFRCTDGFDSNGASVGRQCQPQSGTCSCTSLTAGQEIPCEASNQAGVCSGTRTCVPATGYSACSARVPTDEVCNALDDNCNGSIDEKLGETTCGIGECQRQVSNCVNGAKQTCTPGQPSAELCDEKDNDCDGVLDNGFDKQSDVKNCGACGKVCAFSNAAPLCVSGVCELGACQPGFWNIDGSSDNGCEYRCTVTGAEACDGIDNDCDGVIDDGFSLTSDPLNCGTCGKVCRVAGGTVSLYACVASVCEIAACSTGRADCDQVYATGCETETLSNVSHCGGCGVVCSLSNASPICSQGQCRVGSCQGNFKNCDGTDANGCEVDSSNSVSHCGACGRTCQFANATPSCVSSACQFSCLPGFFDRDGISANGCEFACTIQPGADLPDDNFADQNCDGIDGDASQAIFVAVDGLDANAGTQAQPKRTLAAAMTAAAFFGKPHIYISEGTYDEQIVLQSGISLYGGYSRANGWKRGLAHTATVRFGLARNKAVIAVSGKDITQPTVIDRLTIRALDTVEPETSVYGLHCTQCTHLSVRYSFIFAGSAGAGAAGFTGVKGDNGGPGQSGGVGDCDRAVWTNVGGIGGTSSCGRTGGTGGNGGSRGTNSGFSGAFGIDSTPGGFGGFGADPGRRGSDGTWGGPGADGASGLGGVNGSVVGGFWQGAAGNAGELGGHGNGGGGGGGGGGQGGFLTIPGTGNGGGGGGAGGCGGKGGNGGGAGGGSFAVFLVDSANALIEFCNLNSSNGGNGGSGAAGGAGGLGGDSGLGGNACTGEVGAGGNGGKGGEGGKGGVGGGGAGGPSFALYTSGGVVTLQQNTLNFGNGGLGGNSSGNAGAAGAAGTTFPP